MTGTKAEIEDLRQRSRQITGKGSYHKRIQELHNEHMILDYDEVEQAFAARQYELCSDRCFSILAAKPLSDTIKAKIYMFLSRREIIPNSPLERALYAGKAIKCWDVVIGREGYCHTRFPVKEAKKLRDIALHLQKLARADVNNGGDADVVSEAPPPEGKENVRPVQQESQEL